MAAEEMYQKYFKEERKAYEYETDEELMEDICRALGIMMLFTEQDRSPEVLEDAARFHRFITAHIKTRLKQSPSMEKFHLIRFCQREKLDEFQRLCLLSAAMGGFVPAQGMYVGITEEQVQKLYAWYYAPDWKTCYFSSQRMEPIKRYLYRETKTYGAVEPGSQRLWLKPSVTSYLWGYEILTEEKKSYLQWYSCQLEPEPFFGCQKEYQQAITLCRAEYAPHFLLCGGRGAGKKLLVTHMAKARGRNVIFLDYSMLCSWEHGVAETEALCMDALFLEADICICHWMSPMQEAERKENMRYLFLAAKREELLLYLLSEQSVWNVGSLENVLKITIPEPDSKTSMQLWNHFLADYQTADMDVAAISSRYFLRAGEIKDALKRAAWIAAGCQRQMIEMEDLTEAVKQEKGAALGDYADLLENSVCWDDLIVKEEVKSQLTCISNRLLYKHTVETEWGFDKKISYGKGICALFYGPPGTGKTMAARALANKLGLELYRIDISRMMSKYIGETQKHISDLFDRAKHTSAILFFDEADAFFSRRTDVTDANDRNANSEIAHLLQKLEEYDGISVLATNLKDNIDAAFKRRIQYMVHFCLPDAETRKRLWKNILPPLAPAEDNLDLDFFAEHFEMSGSEIKDALLQGAFLAAEAHEKIGNRHIAKAVKMIFQKYGRILTDEDFEQLL